MAAIEQIEELDESKKRKRRPRRPDLSKEDPDGPITKEGEMPKKTFYRARAHVNPLSHNNAFAYPVSSEAQDWSPLYPNINDNKLPTIIDVGCGFGGLTVALAEIFPNELSLGMEIRAKVCEFVRLRIEALRHQEAGKFQNVSVLRTNSMRYLPNYFKKAQLTKLFFCFPDPHFKVKNHRRRIITDTLLTEYAYVLSSGGRLYCITDVEELHEWHMKKLRAHPCYTEIDKKEAEKDPAVDAMINTTEEGKKVARAGNSKYWGVFERLSDAEIAAKIEPIFEEEN